MGYASLHAAGWPISVPVWFGPSKFGKPGGRSRPRLFAGDRGRLNASQVIGDDRGGGAVATGGYMVTLYPVIQNSPKSM